MTQTVSTIATTEYIHPHDAEFVELFKDSPTLSSVKNARNISWKKDSNLPKALFIIATTTSRDGTPDSSLTPLAIWRDISRSKLDTTHNMQIRHIPPDKDAKALWSILETAAENEPPELVVIFAHSTPGKIQLTNHPVKGALLSQENQLAKTTLSKLPKKTNIVLSCCFAAKICKEHPVNMEQFFKTHAPQCHIHASEYIVTGFTWNNSTKNVTWQKIEPSTTQEENVIQALLKKLRGPILNGADNKELYSILFPLERKNKKKFLQYSFIFDEFRKLILEGFK